MFFDRTLKETRARRRDVLAGELSRAGFGAKLLGGPIAANPDIFQMDVHQTPRAGEYLRIYPGAAENEIEVLSHDLAWKQLVLRVREAPRPFRTSRIIRPQTTLAAIEAEVWAAGGRVLSVRWNFAEIQLFTPHVERRYLCGRDDLRLFIAQIPSGTTVAEAHEALKPAAVREAERRGAGPILRQGEWFFVPPGADERARLASVIAGDPSVVRAARGISGQEAERPHVAEEVVRVRRRRGAWPRELVYARGQVRHDEHRPVPLSDWRRVIRNAEVTQSREGRLRLRWID